MRAWRNLFFFYWNLTCFLLFSATSKPLFFLKKFFLFWSVQLDVETWTRYIYGEGGGRRCCSRSSFSMLIELLMRTTATFPFIPIVYQSNPTDPHRLRDKGVSHPSFRALANSDQLTGIRPDILLTYRGIQTAHVQRASAKRIIGPTWFSEAWSTGEPLTVSAEFEEKKVEQEEQKRNTRCTGAKLYSRCRKAVFSK